MCDITKENLFIDTMLKKANKSVKYYEIVHVVKLQDVSFHGTIYSVPLI